VAHIPESLGQIVKNLRKEKGLTQTQLGRDAGYKGGAGVTISRIESGQLEPSPERLEGIARVLGVSPDELIALAESDSNSPPATLTAEYHDFARAQTLATNEFLLRLREIAARLLEVKPTDLTELTNHGVPAGDDEAAEATYRLVFTRVGVEIALAAQAGIPVADSATGDAGYAAFIEAVARGALSGVTVAVQAKGNAPLKGLHAAMDLGRNPAAPLPDVLHILGRLTSRLKPEDRTLLRPAPAWLLNAAPFVRPLLEILPNATDILDYIATHAGHALARWETGLKPGPLEWSSIGEHDRQRYMEFVEIAAVLLVVANLPRDLATSRGDDLKRATLFAGEALSRARRIVTSYV
jgi:transcriptional regulator with XRE-family HTH domain